MSETTVSRSEQLILGLSNNAKAVFQYFKDMGDYGMNGDELTEQMSVDFPKYGDLPGHARRGRRELELKGLVRRTSLKRATKAGDLAHVYVIVSEEQIDACATRAGKWRTR